MGEVASCNDQWLGRDVAVKTMLRSDIGVPEMESRFLREVRIQGQLEHQGILPVYDMGRNDEGAAYFTMRQVNGETLETIFWRLREGCPVTRRAYTSYRFLSIFTSICQTLQYAHSKGVIHRDLKPGNIMICPFGGVYILDWGLAKMTGSQQDEKTLRHFEEDVQTATGAVMGTPGYMSPEQAAGESDLLDTRTDIYALGAILFEMLTYRPLHEGSSVSEIIDLTIQGIDVEAQMRSSLGNVPKELVAICMKATQKDPSRRYRSIEDLDRDLSLYVDTSRQEQGRRDMAVAHLEEARGFIRESRSSEGHTKALGAVGKALALDPRNAQAKQMLVSLITDESRSVPKDAQSEINLLGDECFGFAVNMAYKAYAAVGLTFLVYALATLSTRTWEPWLASLLWCAAAYVTHLAKDGLRTRPWIPVTNLVLSNMGILAAALVFGSTQVVPLLCLANTCGLVLGGPAELRKQAVAAGLGVMGALAMADTAGLLPQPLLEVQSYALGNTGALASSRTLGVLLVSVMHMIILLCTGAIVGAMRTHLLDLQTRLFLHGWRLRRLFSNREA